MPITLHSTSERCVEEKRQHIVTRRGSVVRTSVCSRWTFPDLRLIYG